MTPLSDPAVPPMRPTPRRRWASARRRAALVTSAALLATGGAVVVSAPTSAPPEAPERAPFVAPAEAQAPPPSTLVPPVALVSSVETAGASPAAEPEVPAEGEPVGSGKASYYGAELAGNPTANGETFDPSELTAAHRTLPFGTRVRVTNERNGESVVVRINDRGPFHGNRVIDVSTAAAKEIGLKRTGTAPVVLERLPKKPARG